MNSANGVVPFFFVITGTLNVLLIKWSDTLQGECSDGKWRSFQHPVLQTALMFLGQCLCFIVYKILYWFLQRRGDGSENVNSLTRGGRDFAPLTLLVPACLDTIASILLFTGLYFTYASSFQMIRGAAIIFIAIFSYIILNQTLVQRHWIAMLTIACGITVILIVDYGRGPSNVDGNSVLTGDLLILCAQIFHAAQFIYEEKLLKGADIPAMLATGWQGIFGLFITVLLNVVSNYLPTPVPFNNNTHGVFDDLTDAVMQLRSNPWYLVALSLFVISSACYNMIALIIVKYSSSANRILADGLRTLFIWMSVLFLEWEYFSIPPLIGFIILQVGAVSYRNAIFMDWYRSLLARLARRRYENLNGDQQNRESSVPENRPADFI